MIDVVILDVAVGAARVQHLSLGIHRHGHDGAVVVSQCLQKNGVGRLSTESDLPLFWGKIWFFFVQLIVGPPWQVINEGLWRSDMCPDVFLSEIGHVKKGLSEFFGRCYFAEQ